MVSGRYEQTHDPTLYGARPLRWDKPVQPVHVGRGSLESWFPKGDNTAYNWNTN